MSAGRHYQSLPQLALLKESAWAMTSESATFIPGRLQELGEESSHSVLCRRRKRAQEGVGIDSSCLNQVLGNRNGPL